MKDTIQVLGRVYDSKRTICDKYGISIGTIARWTDSGLLPQPIRLGKGNYYDRDEFEKRLAANLVR